MIPLIAEVLNIAGRQVGVREEGENRGKRVGEYLRSVGLPPGNPWCAAFCYWVIDQATEMMHQRNPFLRSGYCPYVDSWAEGQGILRETPEPGDVFLRYGRAGQIYRAHHTGFVVDVPKELAPPSTDRPSHASPRTDDMGKERAKPGHFTTYEGNTNLGGSSEGIGVFARERKIGPEYRFVRWADLLAPEPEKTWDLELNGVRIATCPTVGGRALCQVRTLGAALGKAVTWDSEAQAVLFDGEEVLADIVLLNDLAWAPVRQLCEATGCKLFVDEGKRLLKVTDFTKEGG